MISQHETNETECPSCGAKMDMVTGLTSDERPAIGDVSVCYYCAEVLEFVTVDPTSIRVPPQERMESLMNQPAVRQAVEMIKEKRGIS